MSTENHPVVLGTPPSADDQTDLVENHWVPYDRLQQLLTAEAELTRLRAERDALKASLAVRRSRATSGPSAELDQTDADLYYVGEELRTTKKAYTALLIDLRALVDRIQVIIGGLDREIARQRHERAIYCEGKISAFKWVERELTKRLSREPHQDDK